MKKIVWLSVVIAAGVSCSPYPVYKGVSSGETAHFPKKKINGVSTVHIAENSSPRRAVDSAVHSGGGKAEDRDHQQRDTGVAAPLTVSSGSIAYCFSIPRRFIRIALRQNLRRAVFYSAGAIDVLAAGAQPASGRGSFTCSCSSDEKVSCVYAGQAPREYALPCTLHSSNDLNIVEFDAAGYRGSMILANEGRGLLTVINLCDVEDYLRGVVPLEIGAIGGQAAEAVKAQAVAARTYTYKKIIERQKQPFDVLPTIADQVYGGVGAEKPLCNQAIRDCRDLVAVYRDSLIYAYYHSTCGGKTANVEDVWDKPHLPYLRSISDCDESGAVFCRASPNFIWEENWQLTQLSNIIGRFSRETFPQNPSLGRLINLSIESRFPCGRVQTCAVHTSSGQYRYGGDRLRFVVRRPEGNTILRSALITGIKQSGGKIRVSGRGYGHGVGMCQFGAIGRALAGQTCEEIIKSYYTGVEIRSVTCDQK